MSLAAGALRLRRRLEHRLADARRGASPPVIAAVVLIAAAGSGAASSAAAADVGTPSATPGTADDQRLDAAFAELERSGVAAIVAVSRRGGPITVREFGALRDDGVPAEETQVDLNSITKTVTAVMVLELVEQGNVGLDESLAAILPGVPDDKASITVHQLLTHSAGFVDSVGSDEERLTRPDFLERALRTRLASAPGERYRYSNVGYSILAAIIEERSGMGYEAYLRDVVLDGTCVDDTGYLSVYDEGRSIRADGQAIQEASWGGHGPYWNLVGNGGLVSTAVDFLRLRQAVSAGRVVPLDAVARSQEPHLAEDPLGTSHYGYGLVVQDLPEVGRVYWHDGGNDIFSAMWMDFADRGDIVFTAAVDSPEGDAITALATLGEHLYGVTV